MTDRTKTRDAVRTLARVSRVLERGTGELSMAHYRVLAAVADGEEQASRVAARLALGKPTISASVDALSKRGLLTRESATDQRAATLRLTPAGVQVLDGVEAALTARMQLVLAHVENAPAVLAALCALGPALDAIADERLGAAKKGEVRAQR